MNQCAQKLKVRCFFKVFQSCLDLNKLNGTSSLEIQEDIIGIQSTSQKTLESSPNSLFGLESEVDNERGFVKSEESIEDFVERVKGPNQIHRATFYRDPGASLGFSVNKVLLNEHEYKMIVNDINSDGVAFKEGLRTGDQILVVNKVMLRSSEEHEEALDILKSTGRIEIILAQNIQKMTRIQTQRQLHRVLLQNDVNSGLGFGIISDEGKILIERIVPNTPAAMANNLKIGDELVEICGKNVRQMRIEDVFRDLEAFKMNQVELGIQRDVRLDENFYVDGETCDVTIETNEKGMGLSVNSPLDKNSTLGVTIKSVVEDSPAEKLSMIRVGDRIVAVNGESIFGKTAEASMNKLRHAGKIVHLTLMRYHREINNETLRPEASKGKTNQDVEKVCRKWEQNLGPDFEIVAGSVTKADPTGGWGFSLEGLEIEEPSGKIINQHFLKVIAEFGPVGKSGVIKEGDELLEIVEPEKSRVVRSLNHAEAVKMLSSMPPSVHFVVGRKTIPNNDLLLEIEEENDLLPVNDSLNEGAFVLSEDQVLVESRESVFASTKNEFDDDEDPKPVLRDLKWSWEVKEAYIAKQPFDDLGLSITNYERKHIIIDEITPGGAASKTPELGIYDKLISVQGKSIVGRSLPEVIEMIEDSSTGPLMIGVRKLEPNLRSESNFSSEAKRTRSNSPEAVSTSYESDNPTPPPPLTLKHEEPEIVMQAQTTSFSAPRNNTTPWKKDEKLNDSVKKRSPNVEDLGKVNYANSRGSQSPGSSNDENQIILPKSLEQKIAISKMKVGVIGLSVGKEPRGNGVLVKSASPGGAASRDGRIDVGDIIRAINDVTIWGMDINDVRSLLRELGRKEDDVFVTYIAREDASYYWTHEKVPEELTVKMCLYFEGLDSDASLARSNSSMLVSKVKRNASSFMTPSADSILEDEATPVNSRPIYSESNPFKDQDKVKSKAPSFSAPRDDSGIAVIDEAPDHESFIFGPKRLVEVRRKDGEPLGLSILGHEMGVFIKDVNTGSPAAGQWESRGTDEVLNPGDRLISVNGQSLVGTSQQDAVLVIKGARSPLMFIVQSCTVKGSENETLFSSIN